MQAIRWRRVGLAAGATVAAAAAWRAYQRRQATGATRASDGDLASGLAQSVGIGAIDPEPITQIAGEGIDPDASTRAPPRLDDVVGAGVRDLGSTRR